MQNSRACVPLLLHTHITVVLRTSTQIPMLFILCVQGSAVIIPTYDKDVSTVQVEPTDNGGVPIPYLISAPTMRVPEDVSDTVNAYLAFRAVLRCGE